MIKTIKKQRKKLWGEKIGYLFFIVFFFFAITSPLSVFAQNQDLEQIRAQALQQANALKSEWDQTDPGIYNGVVRAINAADSPEDFEELNEIMNLRLAAIESEEDLTWYEELGESIATTISDGFSSVASAVGNALSDAIGAAVELAAKMFMDLAAWLLWAAGSILNISVYVGISQMGEFISGNQAVYGAWTIIRDLINIFFIFGILYIAIKTILFSWSQDTSAQLGRLIIAALLINFSFFFTGILIDASNTLTLSFYNEMSTCNNSDISSPSGSITWSQIIAGGVADCFTQALRIQTIYAPNGGTTVNGEDIETLVNSLGGLGPWERARGYFLGGIFMIITSVVFGATAVMIAARFIALILILVTSPVMFFGSILPKFKKLSDDWFAKLSELLIAMPVLFLFLYMTYQMISTGGSILSALPVPANSSTSTFSGLLMSGEDSMGVLINFIIILGFLVGSLIASKKAGAVGADMANNFGGKLGFGVSAWAGRKTIGRLGNRLANSEYLQNKARNGGAISSRFAKATLKTGEYASKSSFDARNTGAAAALKASGGVDLGKGQKGGFAKEIKDKQKAVEGDRKLYGMEDKAIIERVKLQASMGSQEWRDLSSELAQSTDAEHKKATQAKMDKIEKEIAKTIMAEDSTMGYTGTFVGIATGGNVAKKKAIEAKIKELYKSKEDKEAERVAKATAKALKEEEGGGEKKEEKKES